MQTGKVFQRFNFRHHHFNVKYSLDLWVSGYLQQTQDFFFFKLNIFFLNIFDIISVFPAYQERKKLKLTEIYSKFL